MAGYIYVCRNTSYCVDLDLVATHTHSNIHTNTHTHTHILMRARSCVCAFTHMFAFIPYTHITQECGWLKYVIVCASVYVRVRAYVSWKPLYPSPNVIFPPPRPKTTFLFVELPIILQSIYLSIIHRARMTTSIIEKLNI